MDEQQILDVDEILGQNQSYRLDYDKNAPMPYTVHFEAKLIGFESGRTAQEAFDKMRFNMKTLLIQAFRYNNMKITQSDC